MIPTVTIGVPVKNEENTISLTLRALQQAISKLPNKVKIETIVCLNGTTDNTQSVILSPQNKDVCERLNLRIIRSAPGKLLAEKKIAKARKLHGFLLYCDADIILNKYAITRLYRRMLKNPKLRVVCAKVLPIFKRHRNNFQHIMKSYYDMRYLLSERGCFHGRLFMLRDEQDVMAEYDVAQRIKKIPKSTVEKLYLHKGPICDDIILSAAIVHKYGQDAVERVHSAKVYFYPPDNRYDFFLGVRRYTIEIERINTLFPDYAIVNKSKRFERPVRICKFTWLKQKKREAELLMEFEQFLGQLVKSYELESRKLDLWETVKSSKTIGNN